MRLNKVASEFNITWQRISEFLESVGSPIDGAVTPNARISQDQYNLLLPIPNDLLIQYSKEIKLFLDND